MEDTNSVSSADTQSSASSLQRGMQGDYDLAFGSVISEAWSRVSGNKRTLWLALAIYIAALLVLSVILGLVFGFPDPDSVTPPSAGESFSNHIVTLILMPIVLGLQFVAVARASDRDARPASVVSWYGSALKIFLTYLLMMVLIFIGTLLLVLPGIYLAVSYQLALPLAVDKNLGPWEALEASRKIVTHNWFTFFGLNIVAGIVIMVSAMLFGIPLIWTIPAVMLGFGILYRTAVGAEEGTLKKVATG